MLVETMSYRVGDHSTSDDSTRYREKKDIQWWDNNNNPIYRFKLYLKKQGWWTDEQEAVLLESSENEMKETLSKAKEFKKGPISEVSVFYFTFFFP